jgi:hypothetical protein
MSRTFSSFFVFPKVVFLLVCGAALALENGGGVLAQTTQPVSRVEAKLSVEVEPYCSETKLRTSNARIRWSMPRVALEAHKLTALAGARQSLEATVYLDGFEKGLLVSVPLAQASPERPLAALVQEKKPKVRAFQFSVVGYGPPKEARAVEGVDAEMSAVVEGLEPGVNYTWRITIETESGRIVSESTTSRAVVCPADMAPEKPAAKPARPPAARRQP